MSTPIDFTRDQFALRRSNVGSGNPYDPNSLITGAEIQRGFTYLNSTRRYISPGFRTSAQLGHESTDAILVLAPRDWR